MLLFAVAGCSGDQSDADKTDPLAEDNSPAVKDGGIALPEPLLSEELFDAALVSSGAAQSGLADTSGAAWRLIEVPAAANAPVLVNTPSGWLALSRRAQGDAKAPSAWQSVLYRSADGVHWESMPLDPGHDDLQLSGLAYGAGRYVMVGRRTGAAGVIWSSSDGEQWVESEQELDVVDLWNKVAFAGNRFFAFGFRYLGVSETGERWTSVPITTVQVQAVAYGNESYLLVGSGPMQISEDGLNWQEHELECALPGACISDPSGGIHQSIQYNALFAEGRFFTDQLSSVDGFSWEALPDRFPAAYVNGRFLGSLEVPSVLETWTTDGPVETLRVIRPVKEGVTARGRAMTSVGVLDRESPLPSTVNVEFEDGLNCETASCIILGSRLLLVPPPGTPPLIDRVPRRVDGTPLLTDDCPVSSMIFCEDYKARSGCSCRPNAPRSPESCDDVSHYQCEGHFLARDNEWQVDEVAQAGCTCDAIDPNQLLTFGSPCGEDASVCEDPLECLGIDAPATIGLPMPQPFVCTAPCTVDADCPSWEATGFCSGPVHLRCSGGSCQPRSCE